MCCLISFQSIWLLLFHLEHFPSFLRRNSRTIQTALYFFSFCVEASYKIQFQVCQYGAVGSRCFTISHCSYISSRRVCISLNVASTLHYRLRGKSPIILGASGLFCQPRRVRHLAESGQICPDKLQFRLRRRCTPRYLSTGYRIHRCRFYIFSMHNISRPPSPSNQTRALKARIYIKLPAMSRELQHVIAWVSVWWHLFHLYQCL